MTTTPPLTWPAVENPYSIATILAIAARARQIGSAAAAREAGIDGARVAAWVAWVEEGEESNG